MNIQDLLEMNGDIYDWLVKNQHDYKLVKIVQSGECPKCGSDNVMIDETGILCRATSTCGVTPFEAE